MPCDGKNQNCERRRELLSQLKCLVSAMDRKKPCEWDEPPCPPPACCPADALDREPASDCIPLKATKSFEMRNSSIYRCECIKRNGLQDRCMLWDCMGRPECMTKLYPVCYPGRAALLKLTDLGDPQVALEKFYNADRTRESALAAYCRLVCPENSNGNQCCPPLLITPPASLIPNYNSHPSEEKQQFYNTYNHGQQQELRPQMRQQPQFYTPPIYNPPRQQSFGYPGYQSPLSQSSQHCPPCMPPSYVQCMQ